MGAETPGRRKMTAREGAKRLGVSERTIRNLIAEPRSQFEARAAEKRRRVVELREQGLKYREIAEEMDISPGTVATILHHARKSAEAVQDRAS